MGEVLSEELTRVVQQLLILGKGDQGRLEYILDLLQRGKILPDSDKKYLQIMVSLYLESNDIESYQKNAESAITHLHDEIQILNDRISKIERKGFEKYLGRKAVLFFITVFVGWNAMYAYLQSILTSFIPNVILQYLFPLNLVANYFNYGSTVWLAFVILLLAWPFIASIHLAKYIRSRKISGTFGES